VKCHFCFPKPYTENTKWEGKSSVQYWRRDNGEVFYGRSGYHYTNRDVVPHNPWLLKKYQCHICVLACNTKIASIRYLFCYTTKGTDMATVRVSADGAEGTDEINQYLNGQRT
jgi:hypothetical protein